MNISVGTDLVAVRRLQHAVEAVGEDLLNRVFTPAEQAGCGGDWERLAGHWAAKEAALKALGAGVDEIPLVELEVLPQPTGAPTLHLSGTAGARASRSGWSSWSVSISHDAGMALAVVVALGDERSSPATTAS